MARAKNYGEAEVRMSPKKSKYHLLHSNREAWIISLVVGIMGFFSMTLGFFAPPMPLLYSAVGGILFTFICRGFILMFNTLAAKFDEHVVGYSRLKLLVTSLILTLVAGTVCLVGGAIFSWPIVTGLGYLVLILIPIIFIFDYVKKR